MLGIIEFVDVVVYGLTETVFIEEDCILGLTKISIV